MSEHTAHTSVHEPLLEQDDEHIAFLLPSICQIYKGILQAISAGFNRKGGGCSSQGCQEV